MANHVPGLAEVSDEPYSDSAISAVVDGNHGSEVLETDLAHGGGRILEHEKAVFEHMKEGVSFPGVLDRSFRGGGTILRKHVVAGAFLVLEAIGDKPVSCC